MFYFAYGSNMDPRQMKMRCPSSRFDCVALLPDHKISFTLRSKRRRCGVANIVPSTGGEVFGVLYQINGSRDWEVLDAAEGFQPSNKRGNTYIRTTRNVQKQGKFSTHITAYIYIGVIERSPPLPSKAYLNQMITGAKQCQLPDYYLQSLKECSYK